MSRRDAFDEGTSGLVSRMVSQAQDKPAEEQARAEGKKLDGRGRPGNAGRKGRDRSGRSKAGYDISLARQQLVNEIATAEGVSKSDVVELALQVVWEAYQAGVLDFYRLRRPARSLRVEWKIEVPENLGLFSS